MQIPQPGPPCDGVVVPVTACGIHLEGPGPGLTSFAIALCCVPS